MDDVNYLKEVRIWLISHLSFNCRSKSMKIGSTFWSCAAIVHFTSAMPCLCPILSYIVPVQNEECQALQPAQRPTCRAILTEFIKANFWYSDHVATKIHLFGHCSHLPNKDQGCGQPGKYESNEHLD